MVSDLSLAHCASFKPIKRKSKVIPTNEFVILMDKFRCAIEKTERCQVGQKVPMKFFIKLHHSISLQCIQKMIVIRMKKIRRMSERMGNGKII
jgi:spore coat protein U-like protein